MIKFALASLSLVAAAFAGCASHSTGDACCSAEAKSAPPIRHVVLFKFKEGVTPEQIKKIEQEFAKLPSQIPQIAGFEWGINSSPEPHSQGHTHAFLVTFKTAADRDAYLPHPAHKVFVDLLLPSLEKATVVDYVVQK